MKQPRLILVGAGPGDPELITLKGIKAIEKADAILYDALANDELLEYARPNCVKIYVGKRYGEPSMKQDEINELIVSTAFHFGTVVRLKGGDPFIFGRATEEIDYAETFGIETEVVPGLSSATAIASTHKIALTQRGVSRGFRVITGTLSDTELNEDLINAANSNETTVILMGMNKLALITELFSAFGKNELPVAIIQNGTLANERIITGQVKNIAARAKKEKIGSPAIIIIGESVNWRNAFVKLNINETKNEQ